MNKENIIRQGNELLNLSEFSILREQFDVWKNIVLSYARYDDELWMNCKMQLHVGDTIFENNDLVIQKYRESIKKTLKVLNRQNKNQKMEDAYFYKCSKLIVYVYDKNNVIKDVTNFKAALSGTREQVGKEVVIFVEQQHDLV